MHILYSIFCLLDLNTVGGKSTFFYTKSTNCKNSGFGSRFLFLLPPPLHHSTYKAGYVIMVEQDIYPERALFSVATSS